MDSTIPWDATPSVPPSANGHGSAPDSADIPHPDQAGGCVWRYSRQDLDRETTRYLSAATQLNVEYASTVVRRVINEPIRALAPAYGVDVAAVTRWAVDSLLRRWRRDMQLLLTLFLGGLLIWWLVQVGPIAGTGAVAAMVTAAWIIVAREYWVRWYGIVVRNMLRDAFDPASAPEPGYQWVRDRIDTVSARKRGNLVIFQGKRAFVGSGQRLSRQHVIIDVSHGRKVRTANRGSRKNLRMLTFMQLSYPP